VPVCANLRNLWQEGPLLGFEVVLAAVVVMGLPLLLVFLLPIAYCLLPKRCLSPMA